MDRRGDTVVLTTGNWDSSSGNFTFTQGTSTVQLDAAAPTVTQKAGDQFYNLVLQQGGTLGSNVIVGNSLTAAGAGGGGSLGLGGFTLTVGGNFNLKPGAAGATLVSAGSTVVLDGAAGQNLTTNNQSFDNLTLTTGTKTVTVTGSLTLTGNLEVQANQTLAMSANALSVGGTTNVDSRREWGPSRARAGRRSSRGTSSWGA